MDPIFLSMTQMDEEIALKLNEMATSPFLHGKSQILNAVTDIWAVKIFILMFFRNIRRTIK